MEKFTEEQLDEIALELAESHFCFDLWRNDIRDWIVDSELADREDAQLVADAIKQRLEITFDSALDSARKALAEAARKRLELAD